MEQPTELTHTQDVLNSKSLATSVLITAVVLMSIGVVMTFSTSATLGESHTTMQSLQRHLTRQPLFCLIGLLLMYCAHRFGHEWLAWRTRRDSNQHRPFLMQVSGVLLAGTIALLVLALLPGIGVERGGAARWLTIPGLPSTKFQPSELAKATLVVFLSAWLSSRPNVMRSFWTGILPPAGVVALVSALIGIEDLGTSALILFVGGVLILAAGAKLWHALILSGPALVGLIVMVISRPYRVERIMSFRDIWADPLGSGYHAIQSLVTIASGNWQGRGIGAGVQKYGYLPEASNDFIFAIICEETGVVGGLTVLCLYLGFVILGWRVMTRAHSHFGAMLALGITLTIGAQAAMNIAVVTVSVPTKGISLPLISAGGSGILVFSTMVGLLASVAKSSCAIDRSQQTLS